MVFRISDQNRNAQWIRQGAEVAKVPRSIASMTRAPSNPVRRCFLERARLPWKPTQERSSPAGTWTLRDHKLPISAAASLRWVTEMTSRHLSGLGDTADPLCLPVRITATRRPPTRTGTAARETRAPQRPPSAFPYVKVSAEYGHSTTWEGCGGGHGRGCGLGLFSVRIHLTHGRRKGQGRHRAGSVPRAVGPVRVGGLHGAMIRSGRHNGSAESPRPLRCREVIPVTHRRRAAAL